MNNTTAPAVTITDVEGASGTITVANHDVAETITPWFPEAPLEITEAIADLQASILQGDHAAAASAAALLGIDYILPNA